MTSIPTEILAAIRTAHAQFYPRGPFVSIQAAQGILESANWTEPSGKHNFWGVTATEEQIAAGEATSRPSHETINGKYVPKDRWFVNYPSVEAAALAHAKLLTEPWYIDCQRAATPDAYADALQKDGYATGIPGHSYAQALKDLMKQDNLYALDSAPAPPVPSPAPSTAPAKEPDMFSFANIFALLANAPTAISAVETGIGDVQTLLQEPAVKDLEALIGSLFSHTTTAGAASILEPKTQTPGKA